jgi:predicted outer membrane repeat protein
LVPVWKGKWQKEFTKNLTTAIFIQIHTFNQGTVIMNNNTFDGNIANCTAGAVVLGGATGKGRCNIFKNNSAGKEGGAVYVSNDVLVSEHNTWVANKAEESGGAFFVYAANVNANSDTFAGNQAPSVSQPFSWIFSLWAHSNPNLLFPSPYDWKRVMIFTCFKDLWRPVAFPVCLTSLC